MDLRGDDGLMLRPRVLHADLSGMATGLETEIAGFLTGAMRDTTDDVKDAFRQQVRGAGLGDRLADAVRNMTYPKGRASLAPAGWVYAQPSKKGRGAAAIVESYADGANIVPRNGKRWLAVPTDDCPRKPNGRWFTPADFRRKLVFVEPGNKGFGTSPRHAGVGYLVLKKVVANKPTERERAGTARTPRQLQSVVMFTLVPSVKKPRSINLSVPEEVANERFPRNLDANWRA